MKSIINSSLFSFFWSFLWASAPSPLILAWLSSISLHIDLYGFCTLRDIAGDLSSFLHKFLTSPYISPFYSPFLPHLPLVSCKYLSEFDILYELSAQPEFIRVLGKSSFVRRLFGVPPHPT